MAIHFQPNYKHLECQCGGVIGMYDNRGFSCEKCGKEYSIRKLEYDTCLINNKTGWIFPVVWKENIIK